MSLITTANSGSPAQDYFVTAAYTAGGAQMIATSSGVARIQAAQSGPSAGTAFLRGSPDATTLSLGASDAVPAAISMTLTPSSQTSLNTSTVLPTVGTVFGVTNTLTASVAAVPGAGSLDTYTNRDIHGYSDTGYVSTFISQVGAGPVANPVPLPQGLYSVMVVPANPGNEAAQASACCYWNGAAWSGNGVSFNFTGGAPNVAIGPAAGGATLEIGGAAIPAGNLIVNFRQLLAAPNL